MTTKDFWKISAMHLHLHGWPLEKITKIVKHELKSIEELEKDQEFMAHFDSNFRKDHYDQNHR